MSLVAYEAGIEVEDSYISYGLSGRLGDSLLSYSHARWLSYKYDLPILYSEFEYSNELKLITKMVQQIKQGVHYARVHYSFLKVYAKRNPKVRVIYEVPYFSDFPEENSRGFCVDWSDPIFRNKIREDIAPLREIVLFKPREDILSVAAHIRTTGGYDPDCIRRGFPHKFCDLDFYAEAIKKLAKLMQDRFCYVRVFTDAIDPPDLIRTLQSKLLGFSNVVLEDGYTEKETHTILTDFFSLALYPILIRSQSNFSYMAARIGATCLEIFPKTILRSDGECFHEIQIMRIRHNDELHSEQIVDQIDKIYLQLR